MPRRRRRVFLGTVEIAGFYTNLAQGLRELGVDCSFVELSPHPFQYNGSENRVPSAVRFVRWLANRRVGVSGNSLAQRLARNALYRFESALRIVIVLPWAAARFDVFCFGFNSNIVGEQWGHWDLALLRALRKRIVRLYHGADSRAPYLTGTYVRTARAQPPFWSTLCKMSRDRKRLVTILDRHAQVTLDSPSSGHFHAQRFVVFARVGLPCSPPKRDADETVGGGGGTAVRIVHAPSDRAAKGSDLIVACVDRLKARGYDIEYSEIHGQPHNEVLRQLARCDFVIDQMYADGPMAGLATEAASLGKPTIVCGYVQDRSWFGDIPTHYCHPDELESAVTRLVEDHRYREALGRRARDYVLEFRSRQAVAGAMLRVIDGDIPQEWWFDPRDTSHLHGAGMNEAEVREALRGVVDTCGAGALQLDDKPMLRDQLLRLAGVGVPGQPSIASQEALTNPQADPTGG